MRYLIALLITLLSASAHSQSLSIAPESFSFWGKLQFTTSISLEYNKLGVHYFNVRTPQWHNNSQTIDESIAISYKPIQRKYANIGIIAFDRKFPTNLATHINFWLELKIPVKSIDISYLHISNAYRAENYGYDTIQLRINM